MIPDTIKIGEYTYMLGDKKLLKDGDYMLDGHDYLHPVKGVNPICKCNIQGLAEFVANAEGSNSKKVISSDDPELIADGVLPIEILKV